MALAIVRVRKTNFPRVMAKVHIKSFFSITDHDFRSGLFVNEDGKGKESAVQNMFGGNEANPAEERQRFLKNDSTE